MNIDFNNIKCKLCNRELKNRRALGNHLVRSHKPYNVQQYVLEFFYDNKVPKCACGCGNEVKWHKNLYKYNDYLTGHNESIFGTGEYKETKETKEKRIKNIRKAYEEKGKVISEKISSSVKEAFNNEEKKKVFSELSKDRWKDKDYKERLSKSHKDSWQKNYEERYNKVFTEEFRKKISNANKNRENKAKSDLEVKAFNEIKKSFPDAICDYWIELEEKNKCFDVFIPSLNLLVELDGKYWHGRDRKENFTKDQIVSMTNDLIKNRVASLGYNICRIVLEDNNFNVSFNRKEDLYNISYYVKDSDRSQNKDGMFKFSSNKDILLSRDHVIKLNLKDRHWVENNLIKPVSKYFQEYTKSYGWFYPEVENNLSEVIAKLRKRKIISDKISSSGQTGNSYLKSNFKSFWNVKNGPVDSWNKINAMEKVVKYRLGINNSKTYNYTLSCGSQVDTNETFDINPHNIVRGFIVQRKGVSWFKPVVAYEIYKSLLKDIETPVVWDPSMGFGARMLGFCSAYEKGVYFGTDPAKETYEDLYRLKENIKKTNCFEGLLEIKNLGSEIVDLPKSVGDLVFTSPPYFNTEKYFNEDGQCWKDYPQLDSWKENYLRKTFENSYSFLKKDSSMCINISEKYENDIIEVAESVGFVLEKTWYLDLKIDHFKRKKNITSNKEPILIFRKKVI